MSSYVVFKLLHVFCAIIWVGGGFTLLYAAGVARRKRGPFGVMPVVDIVALLGPPLFVPIALLTVVFGVTTALLGSEFNQLWVILGLAGFVATFLNGILLIKPRAEELAAMAEENGPQNRELLPYADRLLMIARFDYVMLLLVVAVMVLKPGPGNLLELSVLAALLVIGTALTLVPGMKAQPVSA